MAGLGDKPRPTITAEKLAADLQQIISSERPSELIQASRTFREISKLIGEERLIVEIGCLMYFAVDAVVISELAGRSEQDLVEKAFLARLETRIGSTFFEMFRVRCIGYRDALSKAMKGAPLDNPFVGRKFAELCGLKDNGAVARLGTVLFKSTSEEAQELIAKYSI